mmetsp:Transcript_54339/g.172588  ORF Transcript_54339/g.172588 Transcript_54339/m.172588 type:complete len:257 (-) Transcript_54339:493-1263(-)
MSMCTCPGRDSQSVGWIAPHFSGCGGCTSLDLTHVTPPSSEISTKPLHAFLRFPSPFSREAGATHVPLLSTRTLFFTGPRPPWSPGTSSRGFSHVAPPSSLAVTKVSHSGIFHPTLKYRRTLPGHTAVRRNSPLVSAQWRTGFQWGSPPFLAGSPGSFLPLYGTLRCTLADITGFPQLPSLLRTAVKILTSSADSKVPPNQPIITLPPGRLRRVVAWHWGVGACPPRLASFFLRAHVPPYAHSGWAIAGGWGSDLP